MRRCYALPVIFALLVLSFISYGDIVPDQQELSLIVPKGFSHLPIGIVLTTDAGENLSAATVGSNKDWVVPSLDAENSLLRVAFSTASMETNDSATITVDHDGETSTVLITATIDNLIVINLRDDPFQSRVYGLHNSHAGSAVFYLDSLENGPVYCRTVAPHSRDFDISETGEEIAVISSLQPMVEFYRLSDLELQETLLLDYPDFTPEDQHGIDSDKPAARVVFGKGDILYCSDSDWAPKLHVIDRLTNSQLQTILFLPRPGNASAYGFGEFALTPDGSRLVAWSQLGWSAGRSESDIGWFEVLPDGTLDLLWQDSSFGSTGFNRDPINSPVIMNSDGSLALMKNFILNPNSEGEYVHGFAESMVSMSPNGRLVGGDRGVYDSLSGELLVEIYYPGWSSSAPVQVFTGDYHRLVYYDRYELRLGFIDLSTDIGMDEMGLSTWPENGSSVSSPDTLQWIPEEGVRLYEVYLGSEESAVTNADKNSPEYLGRVMGTSLSLETELATGPWSWRVDAVRENGTDIGTVRSFNVSVLKLSENTIHTTTVEGDPACKVRLSTTETGGSVAWSASSETDWIRVVTASGHSPDSIDLELDATDLKPGLYSGSLTVLANAEPISVEVSLLVEDLNVTVLGQQAGTSRIFAISEESASHVSSRAYMIELDADSEGVVRVVRAGAEVTDLAVHVPEQRIYVTNHRDGELLAYGLDTLQEEQRYEPFPQSGNMATYDTLKPFRVTAGSAGKIILEPESQWINISLMDTATGTILDSAFAHAGNGATDSSGNTYFHGEFSYSGAKIQQYSISGSSLTLVQENRPDNVGLYGGGVVILSEDGNKLHWGRVNLDMNFLTQSFVPVDIYSATADLDYLFSRTHIYDSSAGQDPILWMPVYTEVSLYNLATEKLIVQDGDKMGFFRMTDEIGIIPDLEVLNSSWNSITVRWPDRPFNASPEVQIRGGAFADWTTPSAQFSMDDWTAEINGLEETTDYEIRVRFSDGVLTGSWSDALQVTTKLTPPPVPNIHYNPPTATTMTLNWVMNGEFDEVVIEFGDAIDDLTQIAVIGNDVTSFQVTGLDPSTIYYARMQSTRQHLVSEWSSIFYATTVPLAIPAAPELEFVYPMPGDELGIAMMLGNDVENSHIEYRLLGTTQWSEIATTGYLIDEATVVGLPVNEVVELRAWSENAMGASGFSEVELGKVGNGYDILLNDPLDTLPLDDQWYTYWSVESVLDEQSQALLKFNGGQLYSLGFDASNGGYVQVLIPDSQDISDLGLSMLLNPYGSTVDLDNAKARFVDGWWWFPIPRNVRHAYARLYVRGSTIHLDGIRVVTPLANPILSIGEVVFHPMGSTKLAINWSHPLIGKTGSYPVPTDLYRFQVERRVEGGDWEFVDLVTYGKESVFYYDSELDDSLKYQYRVATVVTNGTGPFTESAWQEPYFGWDVWQREMFDNPESPEADMYAVHNGMTNLERYAYQINHFDPVDSYDPVTGIPGHPAFVQTGDYRLTFLFESRNPVFAPEISYIVEMSYNMADWYETSVQVNNENYVKLLNYRSHSRYENRVFYRVRVEYNDHLTE